VLVVTSTVSCKLSSKASTVSAQRLSAALMMNIMMGFVGYGLIT
jgi:hypothetical protein